MTDSILFDILKFVVPILIAWNVHLSRSITDLKMQNQKALKKEDVIDIVCTLEKNILLRFCELEKRIALKMKLPKTEKD